MLDRVLEPEVMDSREEAVDYDRMDHSHVNRLFAGDFLAAGFSGRDILDVGTGTAQIPVEICRLHSECRIMAIDASTSMLDVARYNLASSQTSRRIQLAHADAKQLPYSTGMFDAVISNSIVHHIPDPASVISEIVRVTKPGGQIFLRDLVRPESLEQLLELVETYAGNESAHARQLFSDSLHAALSLDEIQSLVEAIGFPRDSVRLTSDRHWTWSATKPPGVSGGMP